MNTELVLKTLLIMAQGMGVILGVMLLIMGMVALLNRVGSKQQ